MNDEDFEEIIDELLIFMHRRHGKNDKYYMARSRIISFIYKVCSDNQTYEECLKLIEESKILERKKE